MLQLVVLTNYNIEGRHSESFDIFSFRRSHSRLQRSLWVGGGWRPARNDIRS